MGSSKTDPLDVEGHRHAAGTTIPLRAVRDYLLWLKKLQLQDSAGMHRWVNALDLG